MRISKKILAAVLAALMVISMMPFTAFAATVEVNSAESFESAIASANAGDTIKLTGDVTFDYPSLTYTRLDVGGLTIDLNGHTITSYNNGVVYAGSNYTIKNGNMTCANGGSYALCIVAEDYDDCENWNVSKKGTNVVAEDLVLEGGVNVWASEVTLRNVTAHGTKYYAVWADEEDTVVTVESGSYSSDCTANGAGSKCVIAAASGHAGTLNIEGGTYKVAEGQTIVLTGATRDVVISGGSFVNEENEPLTVPAQYLADGAVQNDGVVTQNVAKIGSTYYATLEDAVAAKSADDTITLLADVDFTTVYPGFTKHPIDLSNATLDLNGKTITGYNHSVVYVGDNFTIKNGTFVCLFDTVKNYKNSYALVIYPQDYNSTNDDVYNYSENVVIEDVVLPDGGINCYGSSVTVQGKNTDVTGNYYYGVWADIHTTITILDGKYTSSGTLGNGVIACWTVDSSMDVKGGTYTVKPNKALVLAGNRDVEITGGTYNVDPSAYVAEDYTVNGPVDGWYTVYPAGNDTMSIVAADNIDLNINLDTTDDSAETVEYTFSDPYSDGGETTTVTMSAKNDVTSFTVALSPAQVMDDITAVVKDENGDVVREVTTSIADYCNAIIESETTEVITEELKDLAKSTLDYGKAASDYFNYNEEAAWAENNYLTDPSDAIEDLADVAPNAWRNNSILKITGMTYRATSKPELRFYLDANIFDQESLSQTALESNIGTARFVKNDAGEAMLQITGINIVDFNKEIIVSIKSNGDEILRITPIIWVNAAISSSSSEMGNLGKAIGNYYLKSVAYFGE